MWQWLPIGSRTNALKIRQQLKDALCQNKWHGPCFDVGKSFVRLPFGSKTVIINPSNRVARSLTAAEGYLELGMPKQALAELEAIQDPGPYRVPHVWLIGEALKADGRFEEAIEPLKSVTHLLPKVIQSQALRSLNECLEKAGRQTLSAEEVTAAEPTEPQAESLPATLPAVDQPPPSVDTTQRNSTPAQAVKFEIPLVGTLSVKLEPGNVINIRFEPKSA